MENTKLRKYQVDAVTSVFEALANGKRKMLVQMPVGTGVITIVSTVVRQLLQSKQNDKILVLSHTLVDKKQLEECIQENKKQSLGKTGHERINVETYNHIQARNQNLDEYDYVILYGTDRSDICYDALEKCTGVMIGFEFINQRTKTFSLFHPDEVVYTYTFEKAVRDSNLPPSIEPKYYVEAIKGFTIRLMEKFDYKLVENFQEEDQVNTASVQMRMCFRSDEEIQWVECKKYNNQFIDPQMIDLAVKKMNEACRQEDHFNSSKILMVFGQVSEEQKRHIYNDKKVIIWDISNLLYFVQNDLTLMSELARIAYYPLGGIDPQQSTQWKRKIIKESKDVGETIDEKAVSLIQKLKKCKYGQEYFGEYERVCVEIIHYLFEEAFYYTSTQYKTKDEHFRMDLICSLKGENKYTHYFWKLLSNHFNSHFVVFEFKNYSNQLDQNLIYITEKYLFNSALRNVAIIFSRKGFAESASFAASGCLKENGKLILDISDDELVKMVEKKANGEEPESVLLEKFEGFLMKISK